MEYTKQIQEIHSAFQNASNELTVVTQSKNLNTEKIERLISIGCEQSIEVRKNKSIIERIKDAKELNEFANYYRMGYPSNKFITQKQVDTICKKYGLVCAPLSKYKGFVPEKNLSLIESFNLNGVDKKPDEIKVINAWGVDFPYATLSFIFRRLGGYQFHKMIGKEWISVEDNNIYFMDNEIHSYDIDGNTFYPTKIRVKDNTSLMICAPSKDIDIKGLEYFGKSLFSITKKTIPDPVVLQPVNGGSLIVTAWGDEASDPIVLNEKHN